MSLPVLKIKFLDYTIIVSQEDLNIFFKTNLAKYFDLRLEFKGSPDLIIFGDFGFHHQIKYRDIPRIYQKSECNTYVDNRYYEHCFGFCYPDNQKHTYIIDYGGTTEYHMLALNNFTEHFLSLRNKTKTKFCNFIYAKTGEGLQYKVREDFCKKLMKYNHIDCPGNALNNMSSIDDRYADTWNNNKPIIVSDYKFTIAFENQSIDGYVTEKFFHPLLVKSIPIYWGDPNIGKKFNTKAFINCHDYDSFEQVIEHIIEVDSNDDLYQSYLNESPFLKDNFPPEGLDRDFFDKKFVEIVKELTSSNFQVPKRPFPKECLIQIYKKIKRRIFKS
jgi:hypothetical protein